MISTEKLWQDNDYILTDDDEARSSVLSSFASLKSPVQKFKILEEITSKEISSGKKWKPSYQAGHHCPSQETYWNTGIEENLKKQKILEPLMSWVC